ncbi:MAG TPA: isoprenylcysteine carboxylmethyltransferase family protein [Terriglobales bacterium]|nr:isoprenylcysteine carboxylmethyltransferase family protein [Terriglobales bacterium]
MSSQRGWQRVARRIRVPLGFAFAVIYLWLAHPSILTIVVGCIVVTAGLAVRAVASGQLKKNEALAISGPYSYTRNPLYLGSILIAVGFAIAARSAWIWLVLLVFFVAIYVPVIRSEEAFLRSKFPDFELYARRVPRILPRWSGESVTSQFSRELYLKHREYNALIGAALIMLAIAVKMLMVRNA